MLGIQVVISEQYDEKTKTFTIGSSFRVDLEHSLVSMSKWESFWKKPFLGKQEKTSEETISYVRMMLLTEDVPPEIFSKLIEKHTSEINVYIQDEMTATKIYDSGSQFPSREIITSELIYYWMISMNIPAEFQNWHLNRLIMLIRVINLKNSPKKKMSVAERKAINDHRRAQAKTRG